MLKLPVFLILIAMISCNHKIYSPLSYEGEMLEWGTGGGFTGAVKSYCVLDNGIYFKTEDSGKSYLEVGKMKKSAVRQFFDNYDKLGLSSLKLNEPGNRYYFISRKNTKSEHKLIWGQKELENKVPSILHKNLMKAIQEDNQ
ncbi:MAG: hypothetical protein IPN73_19000 [Saprospiraceae bacterium]|nr:hypothetical protein [Saprospiraceae bacterium]